MRNKIDTIKLCVNLTEWTLWGCYNRSRYTREKDNIPYNEYWFLCFKLFIFFKPMY